MKENKTAILFISLYLFYVAGLLWSSNLGAGLFDLQVKLSLLIFPVIYSTCPLDKKQMDKVLSFFVIGCAIASLILLLRAIYFYFFHNENKFLYVDFSYFQHPSYFAMYLNFALVYLLMTLQNTGSYVHKYRYILASLFFAVMLLLSSKIGYVSLILIIVIWSIFSIIKQKKFLVGLLALIFLTVSIILTISQSSLVYGRIKGMLDTLTAKNLNQSNSESTAVRISIWEAATEISLKRPILGYGTGAADDRLISEYKEEGITRALLLKLNAHNAFCQVMVALGFAGLMVFCISLFYPLLAAKRENNWLYIFFIILFVLSCIPESILETQAGTMYYGFFNSLIFFTRRDPTTNLKTTE